MGFWDTVINGLKACGSAFMGTCAFIYMCGDNTFDFLSEHFTSSKPTLKLAKDRLNLPQQQQNFIMNLWAMVAAVSIDLLKKLRDKKHRSQRYESRGVAPTQANQVANVTISEKVMIYLANKSDDILEKHPTTDFFDHGNNHFNIPTSLWYTIPFTFSRTVAGVVRTYTENIYYYVAIDQPKNYHGVLIAIHKDVDSRHQVIDRFTEKAVTHYNQFAGNPGDEGAGFANPFA